MTLSPSAKRQLKHFQFETLCVSNHTACRFAEKAQFFRSVWAGRRAPTTTTTAQLVAAYSRTQKARFPQQRKTGFILFRGEGSPLAPASGRSMLFRAFSVWNAVRFKLYDLSFRGKNTFFHSLWAGRRSAAAERFTFIKGETL
ncbi:hypothetical protein QUW15_01835 [Desulfovibrio piger]|nr:hypothetical protein [Desulfovibrio piger]